MPAPSARPSCPSCGVAVTPGYQRCPRCHRPLPSAVRFSRIASEVGGGATSLEPEVETVARWPWYGAGIAVLAGAVAVIVIGASGGHARAPLPDDPVVDDEVAEPEDDTVADEPTLAVARPPDPGPAADLLARELAKIRLYATIEPLGEVVEIRSSFCAEPAMATVLGAVAPDLREAGMASVRCRALHGAEQWARALP